MWKTQLVAILSDPTYAGVRHEEVGAEGSEEGRDVRDQLIDASEAAMATVAVELVAVHSRFLNMSLPEDLPKRQKPLPV